MKRVSSREVICSGSGERAFGFGFRLGSSVSNGGRAGVLAHTPFLNCTYRYNVIIIDYVWNLFLPKVYFVSIKNECLKLVACFKQEELWLVKMSFIMVDLFKSLFWFIIVI